MHSLRNAAEYFVKNEKYQKMLKSFLIKNDLGLNNVRIEKGQIKDEETGEDEEFAYPYGIHVVNSKEYPLPFIMESSGTRNLFILLRDIIPVLDSGGIAIIDEIESDLHPHMLPEIIKLFTDKRTNPLNAQLFFTTHCMDIMRELDKTQIILVEKDETYASEAWRLDSMKGIRREDNYYAKYMSGSYGAVPNI